MIANTSELLGTYIIHYFAPLSSPPLSSPPRKVFWVFGALGIVGIAWGTVPTIGWPWMLIFAALPAAAMTLIVPVSSHQ